VLTLQELKASLETPDNVDLSMIPESEVIIAHRNAIHFIRETAAKRRLQITLPLFKELYHLLNPSEEMPKQLPYRRETPLHRLYFHEISPPEKIAYRMKKFIEWVSSSQVKKLHPIQYAGEVHYRLISIYPFSQNSGKFARLIMNLILLHHGFEPIIIHATERQHYYDVLQEPSKALIYLLIEAMKNSLDSTIKYFSLNKTKYTV